MDRNQIFKQTGLAHSVNELLLSWYDTAPPAIDPVWLCKNQFISSWKETLDKTQQKSSHFKIFGYFWPKSLTARNTGTTQDEIFEHFLLILLNPHLLSDTTLPLCFYPLHLLLTVRVTRAAQNIDESHRQVRVNVLVLVTKA